MQSNIQTVKEVKSYEELYKKFKWEVPEYYNFGFDVVDKWAEDRTKLALISIDRTGKHDRYHTFFDLYFYYCFTFLPSIIRSKENSVDLIIADLPATSKCLVPPLVKLGAQASIIFPSTRSSPLPENPLAFTSIVCSWSSIIGFQIFFAITYHLLASAGSA